MFVKMKERHLQNNDDTTASALRYQDWLNIAVRYNKKGQHGQSMLLSLLLSLVKH